MEEYNKGLVKQFQEYQEKKGKVSGVTEEMIRKWQILSRIQTTDITLYYYLIRNHIKEFSPIIYTQTVGWIC